MCYNFLNSVLHHDERIAAMPDAVLEAIGEAPEMKIDTGISYGKVYCGRLIDERLKKDSQRKSISGF